MIHLYCTECPKECYLSITDHAGELDIAGYKCQNGLKFAQEEVACPKRVLTSTVLFKDGDTFKLLPVRTDKAVPLSRYEELMDIINEICVDYEIVRGAIIVEKISGLEANLISSSSKIEKEEAF